MRTGRPVEPLKLSQEERESLQRWARRPKSAPRLARRARIVLGCGDGLSNTAVARRVGVTGQTVGKWRARFLRDRLDGLSDEPRPGAPREISDQQVEAVLTRTLESTPVNATHWSVRSMSAASGLSRSAVHRIWRTFALQPHRSETFKLPKDPLFIDQQPREPQTQIHLLLDHYGTHKAPRIQRWFAKRPYYHIHFTPTSASWLNLVARFFGKITTQRIRRGTFRSVPALEKAIADYLEQHNQQPKPFVWTKSADPILTKIESLCTRINETLH